MAEPVRKQRAPELLDEEPGITLERWVEGPGGRMELVEMPLTPELFLNPQVGDHMTQGSRHLNAALQIFELLDDFFRPAADALVTFDLKHLFGPGLSQPSPDVSVIRGVRDKEADRDSFDVIAEGVRPCLIVEVVSRLSSRIRKTDLEDKVILYRRVGIPEYLIVDSQLRDRRFRLLGYRLGPSGYEPIEPDEEGRLLSETTGLWFQVSPDGRRVRIFEHPSGRLLPSRQEIEEKAKAEAQARKVAEEQTRAEAEARKTAEAEVARLRAEIDRLRKTDTLH